ATTSGENLPAGQLLELVLGLLQRLATAGSVMLVFEDLHWAGQSTLDLAAFLVQALRAGPGLLVLTYRSDGLHRGHRLRPLLAGWERVRSVGHMELCRFGREEVAAQLTAILGDALPPGMPAEVFDRTGGNAYLVEEVAGVVRDGGDPGQLPPSLRDVLLSRGGGLRPAAPRPLGTAAGARARGPGRVPA